MKEIGIQTARQLLDFSGGDTTRTTTWEEQLRGAVALHNILARERVAYLADEVGMGKTYVALGAIALMRHFHPRLRVLYIAPRENIQDKWRKEIRNFTARNWLVTDNRVRTFQGSPAYGLALCKNLEHFARELERNPNRDFLMRMTSFSFGLAKGGDQLAEQSRKKRDALRDLMPWLRESLFDLRNKDAFKANYARAINALLPHFDLLVIDEAHNLKHGRGSSADRNHTLARVLGCEEASADFPQSGQRFGRVLLLSATPWENDYLHLWNQLDLLGFGSRWPVLKDPDETKDDAKREAVRRFLVRRITSLTIGGVRHTKNMYRREWRSGGVVTHDQPLDIPDDRQRLIVALVQRKVAEAIGNEHLDEKLQNSFQIGMLASFESFAQTVKVRRSPNADPAAFDGAEQTDRQTERDGIDTPAITRLSQSYRRTFGESLPHPKMDVVADSLSASFETGEKALIFVRRIASVPELADKLNERYDTWLFAYLRQRLDKALAPDFENILVRYEDVRRRRSLRYAIEADTPVKEGEITDDAGVFSDEADTGSEANFFAWFFRGEGPEKVFSGAQFNKTRLSGEGSLEATFFDDNYVLWLLGEADDTLGHLAKLCSLRREDVRSILHSEVAGLFRGSAKRPRRRVFLEYQKAALALLAINSTDVMIREKAQVILSRRFGGSAVSQPVTPGSFPTPEDFLPAPTFFTELSKDARRALCDAIWPEEHTGDFGQRFSRREQRRELLSSAIRLGHPMIDLWLLAAAQRSSLRTDRQHRGEEEAEKLIGQYLDLLDSQRLLPGSTSFRELHAIAANFDLIVAVNFPGLRETDLAQLSVYFGTALARQSPVGGMWGGVNRTLVGQFRMPGYPLILVTTDVLQEGEDLHTFCHRVFHFGISWTPSATEQRVGRIDRIHSLTQRRLDNAPHAPSEQLLQVYYPHLRDTVERLQVERVYQRLNRFVQMAHQTLPDQREESSRVNALTAMLEHPRDVAPIVGPLESAFPIQPELLHNDDPPLPLEGQGAEDLLLCFKRSVDYLHEVFRIERTPSAEDTCAVGTVFIGRDGELLRPAELRESVWRQQHFTVFLRTAPGGHVLLRCLSPVGDVGKDDFDSIATIDDAWRELGFGKICAVDDTSLGTYDLTIEGDVLLDAETHQPVELANLVRRTVLCADHIEHRRLGEDAPLERFRHDLLLEPSRG